MGWRYFLCKLEILFSPQLLLHFISTLHKSTIVLHRNLSFAHIESPSLTEILEEHAKQGTLQGVGKDPRL